MRAGLPNVAGGLPAAVLPEVPLLAAPTVAEVATALGAELIVGSDGASAREPDPEGAGDAVAGSFMASLT